MIPTRLAERLIIGKHIKSESAPAHQKNRRRQRKISIHSLHSAFFFLANAQMENLNQDWNDTWRENKIITLLFTFSNDQVIQLANTYL